MTKKMSEKKCLKSANGLRVLIAGIKNVREK